MQSQKKYPKEWIQTLKNFTETVEKVIVFTQDAQAIRYFLTETPGRWTVQLNSKFWDHNDFIHDKISLNSRLDFYKIGLFIEPQDEEMDIGLDSAAGKIIFTKNPFFPIPKNAHVIYEKMHCPPVEVKQYAQPFMYLKSTKPMAYFMEGMQACWSFHDYLTLQNIEHSIYGSENQKAIHVSQVIQHNSAKTVLLYGLHHAMYFGSFHQAEKIIIATPEIDLSIVSWVNYLNIIKSLKQLNVNDQPKALTEKHISVQSGINIFTLKKILNLLHAYGIITKHIRDHHVVMIIKQKSPKKDDLVFAMIPEGRVTIRKLTEILKVPREEVLSILKSYENNGLAFTYQEMKNNILWSNPKEISPNIWEAISNSVLEAMHWIKKLHENSKDGINSIIQHKINNHCLNKKNTAFFFDECGTLIDVIDNRSSKISLPALDEPLNNNLLPPPSLGEDIR